MRAAEKTNVVPLERRKEPRKKALIHAFVSDFNDAVDLKCVIRDISKGGCRIASSYVQDLPRLIQIVPEGFDKPMTGKIVWRTSKFAGVQFLSPGEAKEFTGQHAPRPENPVQGGFFARLLSLGALRRRSGQATRNDHYSMDMASYGSRVLHGVRQPLTAIKSLLGLLLGDAIKPIPRRAKSVIRAAHRNAENAERLLGEALHAENIESGKLPCHPVPVEIVELVRDAALVNTGFAAKYNVRFEVLDDAGSAMVRADPARLHEVMTNLLSSAARFSPLGETVSVAVRRAGGSIRVSVSDQGAGSNILHGDADGKHVVADSDDDLGLGLDICRLALEQHGSRLLIDGRPGSGTTVWFELPEIGV